MDLGGGSQRMYRVELSGCEATTCCGAADGAIKPWTHVKQCDKRTTTKKEVY